jgi:hypothetical protein
MKGISRFVYFSNGFEIITKLNGKVKLTKSKKLGEYSKMLAFY